ncbi:hypothetical protein [Mesonia aquimarina]|uniref:hypothetical protein n=1 Tax=Mesonia aquimarina TaxID=1504967 RepID=UPI000EF57AAE|nr:hypothetical protein [Mesonia aquimarina]
MNWKLRILFAIGAGVFYTLLLLVINFYSEEGLFPLENLFFQGIVFTLFSGISFRYIRKKSKG